MNNILKYIHPFRKLKSNSNLINSSFMTLLLLLFSVFKSCIVPYIPEPPENDELLVEGH
jgi:hypothetical protein